MRITLSRISVVETGRIPAPDALPGLDGAQTDGDQHDNVLRLHVRLREARGHVEANRLVQLLRGVFYAAIKAKVWKGENPAAGIKAFEEHGRERYLRPDELVRVNEALMVETMGKWRWAAYFPLFSMPACGAANWRHCGGAR